MPETMAMRWPCFARILARNAAAFSARDGAAAAAVAEDGGGRAGAVDRALGVDIAPVMVVDTARRGGQRWW